MSINYSKKLLKKLEKYDNIITLHTHSKSMPPSPDDFNSKLEKGYAKSYELCHDGTIYEYGGSDEMSELLWTMYRDKLADATENEKQLYAIKQIKRNYNVIFEEVI